MEFQGFIGGIAMAVETFIFASFLALTNERINDLVFKPFVRRVSRFLVRMLGMNGDVESEIVKYVAVLTGVTASWMFGIDLITPLALSVGVEPQVTWIGMAITSVLVGGGSNLLHDVWQHWVQKPAAS